MYQVVQHVRSGKTTVKQIPDPVALAGHVVVANMASLVSAGTERYVVDLARKSLLGKARERPDHVRRVLQKIRQEGLGATMQQVSAKLDEPMPLGYSSAGIVLECGKGVQEFKPGDRVATAGPHAGIVVVGKNLCARIPDGVTFEQASYTSVAAIGLEGVRLANLALGSRVLVIGLGLIGQICVCLLRAQGCRVFGTDVDPAKLQLAKSLGADGVGVGSPIDAVRSFSDSFGVDAAILTAATDSNQPIEFAAEACRSKGKIVLVGVVGLNLPRAPFFQKELEFTVSSSLGPGRMDASYEETGIDYPIGFARWTAQRNMQTVLETISRGQLPVERLTTHHFPIGAADKVYDLITAKREPFMGIVIEYPEATNARVRRINRAPALGSGGSIRDIDQATGKFGVSLIGAGNFARLIMLPALLKIPGIAWRGLCTAKGLNAEQSGNNAGFRFAATDVEEIWKDKETQAVFITTRHNLHAEMVIAALRAGKHVFVEKPLCITPIELLNIAEVVESLGKTCPVLTVGFNRRFAPATGKVQSFFQGADPLSIQYRFAPGPIPANAWPQDEEIGGGRIIGEACHAIDTCTAIAGSIPVRVYAESVEKVNGIETSDDRVFITMRHANGSISNISYQAGGDRGFSPERIEVFGGSRTGVINNWDVIELWKSGKSQTFSGGKNKGHAAEFESFIKGCQKGSWPIPWDELYGVTWASIAAVSSLRYGVPLGIDEEDAAG